MNKKLLTMALSLTVIPSVLLAQKSATEHTIRANEAVKTELNFNDRQDYEDANRGFIASIDGNAVLDKEGKVSYSVEEWDFLKSNTPQTANPSLWRQSQLNRINGLFEVIPDKLYQVRGFDIANMTFIRSDNGWIIIDVTTTDAAAKAVGVNFIGGYGALVHKGFSAGDVRLIESIPRALAETDLVCSSVNIGSTKSGINMDAVGLMGRVVRQTAELTKDNMCMGDAKLVVFCNAPEDNPFMAGAFHGPGEPDCEIHVGVSGPGAVRAALAKLPKDAPMDQVAELVKRTAFKITRLGQLVANLASEQLGVPAGIIDLSLAPTPAIGDSVANILEEMGLESCGCCGTTACLALLNDAVKKGGVMASNHVGGLSGAFIPVSEDDGMIHAAECGCLTIEKLEAMTAVCSVGIDMVIIPGDTTPAVISALIADEAAIGTAPAAERADYCESILRFATVRQMPGALAFGQGQAAKRVASSRAGG